VRRIGTLFILWLSALSALAGSPEETALRSIRASRETLNLLAPPAACFADDAKRSGFAADPCTDLYAAACLGPNGKSKFAKLPADTDARALNLIRQGRDKAAVALGYKSFDEGLVARLKRAGVEVKSPPPKAAWNALKKENSASDDDSDDDTGADHLYPVVDACRKQATGVPKKFNDTLVRLYVSDISFFLDDDIASTCKTIKDNPKKYTSRANPQAYAACANQDAIQQEVVDLYRIEGTPEYDKRAEQFLRANLIPPPTKAGDTLKDRNLAYCSDLRLVVADAANVASQAFLNEVDHSQPFVETMIGSAYSPEKKSAVDRIFNTSKDVLKKMVGSFVPEPDLNRQILTDYQGLALDWMTIPEAGAYTKGDDGLAVLNHPGLPLNNEAAEASERYSIFSDEKLTHFRSRNAEYSVATGVGRLQFSEHVEILPALFADVAENPYAVMAVIAHEAGHKMGPRLGAINGYDFQERQKKLLACFASPKSIGMWNTQKDEVFADYVSAEVLAREIGRLPPESRKSAVLGSMTDYCGFAQDVAELHSLDSADGHPDATLRVAGIFGANPSLRKALGCSGESTKFRSCGLDCWAPDSEGSK
jgi:hypothetical protein